MCLDNLNIFSKSQQYKLLEFHLPLFIFTVKQKKCTNLSQSLLEKLDTLKLHLLRMTLWRNSKHTILVILLNWTSQFNLAAFLSLQDKNLKKSSFHVPNRSWLVWSLLQNTCDLPHRQNLLPLQKPQQRGLDLAGYSTAVMLHICRNQELSCLKNTLFIPPCCSYSTADAVTEAATSCFQVLDMQREISHIRIHMHEL